MNGNAAIEARALRRTFKGGIEAVRSLDMTISRGEVFGFLGPNGAGKTTTVRMLCTLLPPTAGSARVAGLDVVESAADVRRRIGVALQEIGLDPVQTGRELLELQCGLYGITGRSARARAEELLALLGLKEAADRRTKTYSGGMKRRLDVRSRRAGGGRLARAASLLLRLEGAPARRGRPARLRDPDAGARGAPRLG